MTDTWVHQQVQRIRSEIGYKALLVKEHPPKYCVTKHNQDEHCITLDEYEKRKAHKPPSNVRTPPSLDWCDGTRETRKVSSLFAT